MVVLKHYKPTANEAQVKRLFSSVSRIALRGLNLIVQTNKNITKGFYEAAQLEKNTQEIRASQKRAQMVQNGLILNQISLS